MRVRSSDLPGVLIIEPAVHRDARGLLVESYHEARYRDAGIAARFVQDTHTRSGPRTLRGLHVQLGAPLGKLVRCVQGAVFDVAVDVRRGSPAFGQWVGIELSADHLHQIWVPPGFLHGFYVTAAPAAVEYKSTAPWDPDLEIAVRWDDPGLGIAWPDRTPVLSAKDAAAPLLHELGDRLPPYEPD
ncbi:MAG: dTDP-4-dehydrorhamnose 3,5-epimerase [Candidatus Binatia bacterium]